MENNHYLNIKDFVKTFASYVTLGVLATQLGVVQFSNQAQTVARPGQYATQVAFAAALDRAHWLMGRTNISGRYKHCVLWFIAFMFCHHVITFIFL